MPRPETVRRRRRLVGAAGRAVRSRYGEFDLVLEDIAAEVGTSPRQLQRALAESAGTTFRQELLRVRMERARALLSRARNPLSIRATAPRVGYRKPSGLRQAFLRYHGINPSEVQPEPREYLGTEQAPGHSPDG